MEIFNIILRFLGAYKLGELLAVFIHYLYKKIKLWLKHRAHKSFVKQCEHEPLLRIEGLPDVPVQLMSEPTNDGYVLVCVNNTYTALYAINLLEVRVAYDAHNNKEVWASLRTYFNSSKEGEHYVQ